MNSNRLNVNRSGSENTLDLLESTVKLFHGDSVEIMNYLEPESIDLIVTSPPYGIGKIYENSCHLEWKSLMLNSFSKISKIIKTNGFVAIVIGDRKCFPDPTIKSQRAEVLMRQKRPTTAQLIDAVKSGEANNKDDLKRIFSVSDQTIDRRFRGNNCRGSKKEMQTRVKLLSSTIVKIAEQAGLYLYDSRIWVKNPCWETCKYHSISYRSVDEYEHVLVFAKRNALLEICRDRLDRKEWSKWGSRGVWFIPSVHRNDDHPAKFPEELVSRIVKLFSPKGGTIFDPFMGSGTTGCACKKLGRKFVGAEKYKQYFNLSKRKILAA